MDVLLSTAYFAPIQYYSKLCAAEKVILEKFENYQKQTYRNRCIIYSANGPQSLTVPIMRGNEPKILTRDVRIDYSMNWQKLHFKAIESAYRCSPFYEFYIDDLMPFFQDKETFLYDLNLRILQTTTNILQLHTDLYETEDYLFVVPEGCADFRESIHPKKRMFKPDKNFNPPVYTQVFEPRNGFIANMSILDMIFNTGNESSNILYNSVLTNNT